jgi:glycosyltransferase involved in cell wall biosynthesis
MKVILVNTYDSGGAANSCLRLHKGLLKSKVDSQVLLKYKQKNIPCTQVIKPKIQIISTFQKVNNKVKSVLNKIRIQKEKKVLKNDLFLQNRPKGLEWYSFPYSKFDITTTELYEEATIVNLHWVANFIDYKAFFEKNTKPVVWTLHDMNPFSGGEHYAEEFLNIDEFGFPIKRKKSKDEVEFDRKNILIKLQALSNVDNLTIVTPSEWLAEEARKSEVFKNRPVYCIPYGLDSEVFSQRDKKYSRELLNIPQEKQVILFVADLIDNNRKGFVFLKKALEQLTNSNLILCVIGNKSEGLEEIENVLELGSFYDERLMSIAYSAADVFVIPSLIDNLPNTVLESLMCGTPVIGFPVGGIPDMVQDGVNGFITEEISVNSLLSTINKFLNNPSCFNRSEIRNNAIKKYDQKVQSQKYIDLFAKILNENRY